MKVKLGPDIEESALSKLVTIQFLPEKEFLAVFERLVETEEFFVFWALTAIIFNTDSFFANGNNFYLAYRAKKKKFHFIPWGADEGFSEYRSGGRLLVAGPLLVRRLLSIPKTRLRYENTIRKLLESVWNEKEIRAELELLSAEARKHLSAEKLQDFIRQLGVVENFVAGRRQELTGEIERARPHPDPGRPVAEREVIFLAPFRKGRKEIVCTNLRWAENLPLAARLVQKEPALKAWLADGGKKLCASLEKQPAQENHFLILQLADKTQVPLLQAVALQPLPP